jgi:hypothetical protein
MSDTTSVASGLLHALIMSGLGFYAFRLGWIRLRIPGSAAPNPIEWGAITLARLVQGEAAAKRKKAELMKPDRIRRSGYYFLIGGSIFLVGGCLQLVAWIAKIIGLWL